MKKQIYLILMILTSCAGFQQVQLEQTDPANEHLMLGKMPSSNVLLINNTGIIDHFNTADVLWKSNSKRIYIDAINGKLMLKGDSAGKPEDFIYRDFNPLNFTKAGKIILTAGSEATGLKDIYFLLVDDESAVLKLTPEKTGWDKYFYTIPPASDSLGINLKRIVQLNIRPIPEDSAGFSGRINIDEIRVEK
jgi:hypothetical protein